MESSEMLRSVGDKALSIIRRSEQLLERIGEGFCVTVRKTNSTRSDRLGKSATARTDHDAAASNSFQRHHSKRFIVTRWNKQKLVAIENFGKFRTELGARRDNLFPNTTPVSKL